MNKEKCFSDCVTSSDLFLTKKNFSACAPLISEDSYYKNIFLIQDQEEKPKEKNKTSIIIIT